MQLSVCACVIERVLASISGVVCVSRHCERTQVHERLPSSFCFSGLQLCVCAATAALQRQKVKSCMDVSQVGWWGESRIMESILLSVS